MGYTMDVHIYYIIMYNLLVVVNKTKPWRVELFDTEPTITYLPKMNH